MSDLGGAFHIEILLTGVGSHPTARLRVVGEFDRLQVARFDEAAAGLPRTVDRLIVDLTETTIIDSAALGSLVRLRHGMEARASEFEVVVGRPFQVRVMRVGGLYDFLSVRIADE